MLGLLYGQEFHKQRDLFKHFFSLLTVLNLHLAISVGNRNIDETFPVTVFPTLF